VGTRDASSVGARSAHGVAAQLFEDTKRVLERLASHAPLLRTTADGTEAKDHACSETDASI
jgi:hypothetical protein